MTTDTPSPPELGEGAVSYYHYENWLKKAAMAERSGKIASAIHCLEKAATHTGSTEELFCRNNWLKRLRSAVPGGGNKGSEE